MIRRSAALAVIALAGARPRSQRPGAEAPCELLQYRCFGIESVSATLSTTQAGAHPDLTFSFDIAKDPESKPNAAGLHDPYAATRDMRFELPPGLIGNPNVMGVPQQCTLAELVQLGRRRRRLPQRIAGRHPAKSSSTKAASPSPST